MKTEIDRTLIEQTIRRMWKNHSLTEISKELKSLCKEPSCFSLGWISAYGAGMRLPKRRIGRPPGRRIKVRTKAIIMYAMRKKGHSLDEIGEYFDCTKQNVSGTLSYWKEELAEVGKL